MKTTFAIVLLTTFTQSVLAAPPDLECLSDMSFNDAFTNTVMVRRDAPIVILIGDTPDSDSDPTATWAIWNDPQVVKYLKDRKLVVTFLDEDTPDQPYLDFFMPETRPMVIYRDGRGKQHRRSIENLPTTATGLIDWLKYPSRRVDERRKKETNLLELIARNPDDINARMRLIELRRIESDPPFMVYALYPWLFRHNERWFDYSKYNCESENEESFRKLVFNEIRSARIYLGLFKKPAVIRRDGEVVVTKEFRTWIEEQIWRNRQFGQGIQIPPIGVVRQWAYMMDKFSKSCQQPAATDRDLFILKALTAEGEEWEAMIKEYSGNTP